MQNRTERRSPVALRYRQNAFPVKPRKVSGDQKCGGSGRSLRARSGGAGCAQKDMHFGSKNEFCGALFDHTLITPWAPWGSLGRRDRPPFTWNQLLTTGSDQFGWVETVSIPVGATIFSYTYKDTNHTLLTPSPYFSRCLAL